ncbi:hypothetical protein F652_1748 [Enterobacteriaceae bacterium bta3-1]|nr:hypothetical protein F652_1748 [Enterobacteriaceae bacterium bta3-1]
MPSLFFFARDNAPENALTLSMALTLLEERSLPSTTFLYLK